MSAHCASHVRTILVALGQYISMSPLHSDKLSMENKRSSHRLPTATEKLRYLCNATSDPGPVCRVRTVVAPRNFPAPQTLNCDSEHAKCGGVCQTSTPISTFCSARGHPCNVVVSKWQKLPIRISAPRRDFDKR